ncbi:MAG: aminoglycoside 6-adenylyltransferase [Defluviitaleaceae bacterium]|nr:aminoglycoside 6-adenylyltransferase [Defluviitaleaceae bacterium]
MIEQILNAAKSDERIRAVSMEGSRANPAVPSDYYQDYDISYYVTDAAPFFNNTEWIVANFGEPLVMQMPETLRGAENDGRFIYLMIFPDGNRLDLSIKPWVYEDTGEPSVTLLDKDDGNGFRPKMPGYDDSFWHIKPPSGLFYYSCTNNFWWCLNNVAKGIARDELPYVMEMLYHVRGNMHEMLEWYIGVNHGFNISAGKDGKYFKKFLPPEIYSRYTAIYSGSDYADIWKAIFTMCDLFRTVALAVAAHFSFEYKQEDEDGIRKYIDMVRQA